MTTFAEFAAIGGLCTSILAILALIGVIQREGERRGKAEQANITRDEKITANAAAIVAESAERRSADSTIVAKVEAVQAKLETKIDANHDALGGKMDVLGTMMSDVREKLGILVGRRHNDSPGA